ncbi:MAG: hypothetical protein CR986_06115 [Ignavibacteriae bacterium]|nr:MAG: hypothetical protein CR986_06115 [Ignavibacteriota bacterium]
MKKILITVIFSAFVSTMINAQWEAAGPWPDSNYIGGSHGIAVDPDGKVWTSSYYFSNWATPGGDTLKATPIFVFNADGTPADTIYTVTDGTVTDSLTGKCRGLGTDEVGNIIYVQSGPAKGIKINYKTMARMSSALLEELGSSPTAPAVDENGNIFIGPVVGGGTNAIAIYNTEFEYQGNAVVGPPAIARTMEVSKDGNTIYWLPFTAQAGYVYSRNDEFSSYELTDSLFLGMSIESSAWQPVSNLLWVSHDVDRGTDSTKSDLTWYGYDLTSKTFVDSFTLMEAVNAGDKYPRALDFSPDGKIAYVSLFGTKFHRIYKFTTDSVKVDIEEIPGTIPNGIELAQNYPNPFNPSTSISFSIPKSDIVTLRVFDMLGQQVVELLNEQKSAGNYKVTFDASKLASGTYVYMLQVGDVSISKKMLLLK